MNAKRFAVLGLALFLTACGPIWGGLMKIEEGIKQFEVRSGSLSDLHPGRTLLVFGPFAKTDEAFYICRGEDAAQFNAEFNRAGLFRSELYLERNYKELAQTAQRLRATPPGQLQEELGLDIVPELILFATLTRRETTVAPARGVVMEESFRLEFYDTSARTSTVVEVTVRDLAERCIPTLVKEMADRLGRG